MNETVYINPAGSNPLTPDKRDYSHTKWVQTFGSVMTTFPASLGRTRLPVKDQKFSDFCTGYSSSTAGEYMDGRVYSPEWQFAYNKREMGGDYRSFGADPRATLKTAKRYGFLPQECTTLNIDNRDRDFLAQYQNWSQTFEPIALKNCTTAYLKVDDRPDTDIFDDVRVALMNGYKRNEVVIAFGIWYYQWDSKGFVLDTTHNGQYFYHAYTFIDWITVNGVPYLVAHMSNGKGMGDNGFLYFSREIINRDFARPETGLYIYKKLSKEELEAAKSQTILGYLQMIFNLTLQIIGLKQLKNMLGIR